MTGRSRQPRIVPHDEQHPPGRLIRCSRCNRRCRRLTGWNCTLSQGRCVGHLCPSCQTPEENAEAEINAATITYARDVFGRYAGRPKAS